jgi:hypothetical protein
MALSLATYSISGRITIRLWEPPLSQNAIFGSRNGWVSSLRLVSALFVIAYFTFL